MAKIDIVTADLQSLSSKMKAAEGNVGKARMLVSMAQNSLDIQVASSSAINSRLAGAKKKLTAQKTAVGAMASLTVQAAEEFTRADQGSGRIVNDLFDNLSRALGDMAGSLKNFIQSIVVKKHNQTASVFLPAGSILTGSVISGLLGPAGGSGLAHGSGDGRHETEPDMGHTDEKPAPDSQTNHTPSPEEEAAAQQAAKEEAAKKAKEEREKTPNEINTRYKNLPNSKSKKGFKHKCGALTFQQLYAMGIVKSGESADFAKDYASVLAAKGKTSKGYICSGYTGNDALDKLLAANKGKLPITNIVCSFEKGGNIPSNAGHALLISKIDEAGNVYFVDNTKASNYKAVCLSLKDFKAFYFKKGSNCSGVTHLHKP